MKMLMIVIDESKKEELEIFLKHSGVLGFTEIRQAAGIGDSGPRLGSGAFPKTSAIVFTLLTEEVLEQLVQGVDQFCASCGEQLRMVSWDVDMIR